MVSSSCSPGHYLLEVKLEGSGAQSSLLQLSYCNEKPVMGQRTETFSVDAVDVGLLQSVEVCLYSNVLYIQYVCMYVHCMSSACMYIVYSIGTMSVFCKIGPH